MPFSFENITRSAALDTLKALPVSDAARATHESFESHLQRAAAFTPNQSPRGTTHDDKPRERPASASTDASRNPTTDQPTKETRRDGDSIHEDDSAEAAPTSKPEVEQDKEDVEQDSGTGDEVVVAGTIEEQRAAAQELELQASGDSEDNADDEAAGKLAEAALREEHSELDTALATNVEASAEQRAADADGEAANERRAEHSSGEPIKRNKLELQDERDAAQEANDELAASGSDNDGQVPEPTGQEGEALRKNDSQQRRGDRSDITASQPTDKTPNIGTQSVDSAIVEAAADSSRDDSSRQRRNHSDTGSTPPIGHATTVDETTTTLGTPSRFAQHLLAKTADSSTRGKGLTDADQARFVDRVARAVQATGDRGGTLRLRLSPPELGSLTLEIKVQGGAVTARVEADTPTARTLLLENLPLLRERLAEQGLRVDQFDVDLTDRHPGGTPDGLQQNEQQQENRPRSKNSSHEPEETPRANSPEANTTLGSGQLNIIV